MAGAAGLVASVEFHRLGAGLVVVSDTGVLPHTCHGSFPIMRGGAKGRGRGPAQPKAKAKAEPAPKRIGRPRKAAAPERSLETPNTVLEQGFGGRPEFLAAQKDWAATLLPDRRIAVRHQWYDYNKGYKLFLWCNLSVLLEEVGAHIAHTILLIALFLAATRPAMPMAALTKCASGMN